MPACSLLSRAGCCRPTGLASRRGAQRVACCSARGSEKYVIIGAGFAGVATAFHLLESAPQRASVQITVYDVHGLGAGASGAAAGLLHPFSPKGKLTWLGLEGFAATSRLIHAAEAADSRSRRQHDSGEEPETIAVRNGILRLGGHARQSWELTEFLQQVQTEDKCPEDQPPHPAECSTAAHGQVTEEALEVVRTTEAVSAAAAERLVPGLGEERITGAAAWRPPRRGRNRKADLALEALGTPDGLGVHIPQALTINSARYLEALWAACQELVAARQPARQAARQADSASSSTPGAGAAALPTGAPGAADNACAADNAGAADKASAPPHSPPLEEGSFQQGSFLRLEVREVESLERLDGEGEYDAVIVACGAAAAALPEVPDTLRADMDLSHGCCVTLEPPCTPAQTTDADSHSTQTTAAAHLYPSGAPSLLGAPYVGIVRPDKAVVGSSKEPVADAATALGLLRRREGVSDEAAAEAELRAGIEAAWPPFRNWRTTAVKSGVRAVPKFTEEGAPPLLGRLGSPAHPSTPHHSAEQSRDLRAAHEGPSVDPQCAPQHGQLHSTAPPAGTADSGSYSECGTGSQQRRQRRWWLYTGLGTRGLLYHALMAEMLVAAVRADDDSALHPALRRWQYP